MLSSLHRSILLRDLTLPIENICTRALIRSSCNAVARVLFYVIKNDSQDILHICDVRIEISSDVDEVMYTMVVIELSQF